MLNNHSAKNLKQSMKKRTRGSSFHDEFLFTMFSIFSFRLLDVGFLEVVRSAGTVEDDALN